MKRAYVGTDIAYLLLTCSFDFFQIVMVLLQRPTVGHLFHNSRGRHGRFCAEIRQPALRFVHQDYPDTAARRLVSRLEGLDLLDHLFTVLPARHLLPTALLSSPFGKTDGLLAI